MNRTLIGVSLVGFAASGALGGPLNKAVVSKDAQWVFHLDAEAGMASTIGRYIIDHRAELKLDELERVKAEIGIDPLQDIKGVTVYGTGPKDCDGIAVIYTSAAVDQMIARMRQKAEDGIKQVQIEGYTVYTWTEGESPRFAQVRPDGEGRIVIAASDQEHLISGIHVLEGKDGSMKGGGDGLAAASPLPGSIIFASATHLPQAEALPFKHAEGFTFDAGEAEQQIYADVRVTAKSSEEATNMSQVAMGAMAMVRMMAGSNPEYREAVQLLEGVSVSCQEKDVVGKFRIRSDQVGAALTAISEQERHKGTKPRGSKKGNAGDKD